MAKVKFKALTDAAYKAIQAADIDTNKLYFVTDKGALYKGATLIADVTANSAGAFKYKGTIGSTGATVTTLPAVHEQGWIYIVLTAGTYAGKSCQIGDMIVCKASGSVAADTDWDIIPLNFSVVNNAPTLAWETTSTVATIDGKTISVKMPANPNTDTKVTSAPNHYTPIEDPNNKKTASGATGTAEATVQVITGIKMDAKGHVTGIVSGAATDTNTKVTSVANHYTPTENSASQKNASGATGTAEATVQVVTGIKMDDKGHVTGVVSGAATDTDTKVTSVANHYTPAEDETAAITPAKTTTVADITTGDVTVVTGVKRDAKGHVTGVAAQTIKATDTKVTSAANHYIPTEDTSKKQTASGATVPAVGTTQQVIKAIKLDSKGHVVGIESAAVKDTDTDTKVTSAVNHYTPTSDSSAKKTAAGLTPIAGGSGCAIKAITMDDKGHVTGIESVAFGDTMGDLVVTGTPTGIEDASDDLANGEVNVNFLPGDGNVHAHKIEGVNGCEVTYDAAKSTISVECTCCEWE